MHRFLAAPVLVVALALLVPTGTADGAPSGTQGSSTGSFGVRLVPAPGAPPTDPLARLYIVETMAAGTSITRSIDVLNGTASALDVAVYAAAATDVRGKFDFAPGRNANQLSEWTAVEYGMVHVAPGSSVADTFSIRVPQGAASGERTAVLWAEVSSAGSRSGGVTLVNRVGVRLYISVGTGGPVSSDFAIGPITATRNRAGTPSIGAVLYDSSTGTFDVYGTLTLTDGPGGLGAGPFAVAGGSVLTPGASSELTVPFRRGIPRGPWRAHLVLTNGIVDRSATATVTFPPTEVVSDGRTPAPVVLLVLLVLVLLAVLAVTVRLVDRRRRGRADGRSPARSGVPGD